MTSLAEKLDFLTLQDEGIRRDLFGYLTRVKKKKNSFLCAKGYVVIPSLDSKKYVLCKMENGSQACFQCFECENSTIYENMNDAKNYAITKKSECLHVKLCNLLFSNCRSEEVDKHFDEKNYIEVLSQQKNECISLVHTVQEKKTRLPGIVVLTSRTLNPQCHTCKGKKFVHVNIYKDKNEQTEKNVETELPLGKLDSKKKSSGNELDPSDKKGGKSNVFEVEINFPPTKSEKVEIDKINNVDSLFPDGYAIPPHVPGEHCECGNEYVDHVVLGNCESTKMIIHHSKTTKDSRNSTLIVLFRGTLKCAHRKYYLGTQDKLLRVSGIADSGRPSDSPLHFISFDFLFEYHASLISGGTTQHAFIQSKNDINIVIRGQENEITNRVFRKGYEIFIHSLKYDKKDAWGCDDCPKPLINNKKQREEDFDDVEVHVSDGINMGTLENDLKGHTNTNIFDEEKNEDNIVKGIEAKHRTFLPTIKQRKILSDLSKTEMSKVNVKSAISQLKKCTKSENTNLVLDLLNKFSNSGIPDPYNLLISELGKCTPISVILPSHDSLHYKILQACFECLLHLNLFLRSHLWEVFPHIFCRSISTQWLFL